MIPSCEYCGVQVQDLSGICRSCAAVIPAAVIEQYRQSLQPQQPNNNILGDLGNSLGNMLADKGINLNGILEVEEINGWSDFKNTILEDVGVEDWHDTEDANGFAHQPMPANVRRRNPLKWIIALVVIVVALRNSGIMPNAFRFVTNMSGITSIADIASFSDMPSLIDLHITDIIADTPATPTPTPTPTPPPPSAPRYFSGTGDDVLVLEPFTGTYVFVITGNPYASHFAVHAHGEWPNLLVNTLTEYTGTVFNREQDSATLEITATGDWTVQQRPLTEMRYIQAGMTIQGTGDEVLQVLSHGSTATIEGNEAERHFAVVGHGSRHNLMVNTTSPYNGRVMLRGTYDILEISAVGDWTITFEE